MNQITVYTYRDFDEARYFEQFEKENNVHIVKCHGAPAGENIKLARGSTCVNIITTKITEDIIRQLADSGVKYIATRTIGYDHIDMKAAEKYGIAIANAPYGPEGVADYTVMMMLMAIRNMKRIMQRTAIQDYTLNGLIGRELHDLTVGVIGTGRIGARVIKNLSGFGCRIIAYDPYPKDTVKKDAEYVDKETVLKSADLLTFHTPLTDENFHMINKNSLAKMKDGVILINTARGPLIDSETLISGIESGKIGAAAIDVVENEFGMYYNDLKSSVLKNRDIAILRGFPNVTIGHHMAFYTQNAIRTMVMDSMTGCLQFMETGSSRWIIHQN
ncbi:MAG: D-isomer specific 2-hydroxyacid dehydrogenase family protein [Treponema sp.]|jgi:D-lactate dehydrogenase|nr:D-isomer specific 2-hydroxyacid dehydrogenase family protein [Treponema sp.]